MSSQDGRKQNNCVFARASHKLTFLASRCIRGAGAEVGYLCGVWCGHGYVRVNVLSRGDRLYVYLDTNDTVLWMFTIGK